MKHRTADVAEHFWRVGALVALVGVLALLSGFFALEPAHAQTDEDDFAEITIDPATDLVDGQQVEVAVPRPDGDISSVLVAQCLVAPDQTEADQDCTYRASLGYPSDVEVASASITVFRSVDTADGTLDCATARCVVRAFAYSHSGSGLGYEVVGEGALNFDPNAAELDRPTFTVSPNEALVDGDSVTISGEGFRPFDRVHVQQCEGSVHLFNRSGCVRGTFDASEVDGTLSATLPVVRQIPGDGFGRDDCAEVDCVIRVTVQSNGDPVGSATIVRDAAPKALEFDDIPFEVDLPVVRTQPRNDLVDGQRVEVTMEAGGLFGEQLFQCETAATDFDGCIALSIGNRYSSENGFVFSDVVVRRFLRQDDLHGGHDEDAEPVEPVDCAQSPKHCSVFVFAFGDNLEFLRSARGLTFSPDTQVSRATVSIDARNKVVAGEQKAISITNNVNSWIQVRQCPRTATSHEALGCAVIGNSRGSAESMVIQARPVRFLEVGGETPLDCHEPRSCDFRVFGSDGPIRRLLINFVGEPTALPTFTLATQRNLEQGQRIAGVVDAPGVDWVIQQCVVAAEQAEPAGHHGIGAFCTGTGATNVPRGHNVEPVLSDGPVDTEVRVSRFVGGFDCSLQARSCELRLSSGGVAMQSRSVIFATAEVYPFGVLEASPRRNLVAGQEITATVRGSQPGHVATFQCVSDVDQIDHSGQTCIAVAHGRQVNNLKNTREVTFQVQRMIGDVDCAERAGRCVLRASMNFQTFEAEFVNLRFDEDAPEPPGITFTIQPRRDLVHGQNIVIGSPTIAPGQFVDVSQCGVIDGELASGSCRHIGWFNGNDAAQIVSASDAGEAAAVFLAELLAADEDDRGPELSVVQTDTGLEVEAAVSRFVGAVGAETTWDCATSRNACVLRFVTYANHGAQVEEHQARLYFDPEGPGQTDVVVEVRPKRNLAHRQRVNVTISDAFPGRMWIQQCRRDDTSVIDEESCIALGNTRARSIDEPTTVEVQVSRTLEFETADGPAIHDCALATSPCVIRVFAEDPSANEENGVTRQVAIRFDPEREPEPLAPHNLAVSPAGPFVDQQEVTVSGPGSGDFGLVAVLQCREPDVFDVGGDLRCEPGTIVQTDSIANDWQVQMVLQREIDDGRFDCRESTCLLLAFGLGANGWESFGASERLLF